MTRRGDRPVFTDDAMEMIKRMVVLHHSTQEIAEAVGTSVASLKVTCSRLGVSLDPGRNDRPPLAEPKRPLKLYFEDGELAKLHQAAERRRTSATNLIYSLVATILNDGLIDAVLDEEQ
jgi:hypothetical protein